MAKQKTRDATLKGLERRTRQGRRKTLRRKSDPKSGDTQATKAVTEPEYLLSPASEADALVTHCYEELFSVFPELLAPFRDPDAGDRRRNLTAALGQIVNVLRRQDERVKVLKELEQEYRDGTTQTDHGAAIAETLLDLMTDFSSDAWIGAFEQVRVDRG